MNIIPVPSLILLQLVPFLLTISVLYFVLFKPMLKYIDERDEKIFASREKADALKKSNKASMDELQKKTTAFRMEISAQRSEERTKAMNDYNHTVHAAKKEADASIKAEAHRLMEEQALIREELKQTAREIANHIASKTLGRSIS